MRYLKSAFAPFALGSLLISGGCAQTIDSLGDTKNASQRLQEFVGQGDPFSRFMAFDIGGLSRFQGTDVYYKGHFPNTELIARSIGTLIARPDDIAECHVLEARVVPERPYKNWNNPRAPEIPEPDKSENLPFNSAVTASVCPVAEGKYGRYKWELESITSEQQRANPTGRALTQW